MLPTRNKTLTVIAMNVSTLDRTTSVAEVAEVQGSNRGQQQHEQQGQQQQRGAAEAAAAAWASSSRAVATAEARAA